MSATAYALLQRDEVDRTRGRVVALSLYRAELYEPSDCAENMALVEVPQSTQLGVLVPFPNDGDWITDRGRLQDLADQLRRVHRGAPYFRTPEGRSEAGRFFDALLSLAAQVDLDVPVRLRLEPARAGVRESLLRGEAAE